MLKDVTYVDPNGKKRKRFAVRCVKKGYGGLRYHGGSESTFGIKDTLTNTFVVFKEGMDYCKAANLLSTTTLEEYYTSIISNLKVGDSAKFPITSHQQRERLQTVVDDLRDSGYELITIEDPNGIFEVEMGDAEADMEIEEAIKNLSKGESVKFPFNHNQREQIQDIVDDLRDGGYDLVTIIDEEEGIFEVEANAS
jgi:hypothetical protein